MTPITESNLSPKTRRFGLLLIIIVIMVMILFLSYKGKTLQRLILVFNGCPPNLTKPQFANVEKPRCIVVVKGTDGRLGNDMFVTASGYGLARLHFCLLYVTPELIKKMNVSFVFDLSPLLISLSTFNSIIRYSSKPMTNTSKNVSCQYVLEITRPNAIRQGTVFEVQGYWQSYLHFAQYADDIRKRVFAPKQSVLETVSKLFTNIYHNKFGCQPQFSLESHQIFKEQLAQSNWTWIGVHVRRQDFVSSNKSSTDKYLFFAIEYYTRLFSNAHFLVASDDKPYCRKLFDGHPNIFVTPQPFSPDEDLIALSLCQHSILTAGTFGWWAGYLANGHVIHDKVYQSGCERREHYYPPWFLIDGYVSADKISKWTL